MDTLKLGFIGAGFIGNFQAQAMKMAPHLELSGVYALKGSDKLAQYARQNGLGDCKVYSKVADLCHNCDAVALFAPNYVRVELTAQIVDAVKAGAQLKGIICENLWAAPSPRQNNS